MSPDRCANGGLWLWAAVLFFVVVFGHAVAAPFTSLPFSHLGCPSLNGGSDVSKPDSRA